MKKQIIAFLLLLVIGAQLTAHFGYTAAQASSIKIPNEAIRLRILANSDSEQDQALKRKVRDRVKAQIDTWVQDLKSFEDARRVIQSRLPEIEQTVAAVLKEEGSKQGFKVEFGKHVKFPTKVYGNFIYPAGEYEAVLVTLGEGAGANWWCVLFPPLCFLDFASGTAIAKKQETEEPVQEPAEEKAAMEQEQPKEQPKQEKKAVKKTVKAAKARTMQEEKLLKEIEASTADEEPATEEKPEFVKEEKETEVRFFLVDAFHSLFSR
ncbi:stage II sporulation protein R [Ectobacillus ponti]|uniref:Stage II sporulation protein R n=1 Tax=Ectobacillus ponti TaxID=2961894 RepID=A0AA41X680_9BACI|nr:stage II sporulation protein R [Ectobacillus ponti]MCP8967938.1 stage II sporulation protein R [Ectobacillus ponti]